MIWFIKERIDGHIRLIERIDGHSRFIKERIDGYSERGATQGNDMDTSTTFHRWGVIPHIPAIHELWGEQIWYPSYWHTNNNDTDHPLLSHPPIPFILLIPWGVFQLWNHRMHGNLNIRCSI